MIDGFKQVLTEVLASMGVRAVGLDRLPMADRDELPIDLALPPMRVRVTLDSTMLSPGPDGTPLMIKELEAGARQLFASLIDHVAKYDRAPTDRTKALESAAHALLDALSALDRISVPFGTAAKLENAADTLRGLLKQKPGSPSWSPRGYGLRAPREVPQ